MCVHVCLHVVATEIVSSYVLFPLQAPFIKPSCTKLIDVRDHKKTQKVQLDCFAVQCSLKVM